MHTHIYSYRPRTVDIYFLNIETELEMLISEGCIYAMDHRNALHYFVLYKVAHIAQNNTSCVDLIITMATKIQISIYYFNYI